MRIGVVVLSVIAAASVSTAWAQAQTAKEQALGRALAAEVGRRSTPVDNASVRAFVERIGGRLAGVAPDGSTYRFEVITGGPWAEPFALPGGPVFIPTRAFIQAESFSQFATQVAHAMGHIALRHGLEEARPASSPNSPIPLVFMGGWSGAHSDQKPQGQLLVPFAYQERQRVYEAEADRFGNDLAARAGFTIEAGAEFARVQELVRALVGTAPPPKDPPSLRGRQ